MKDLAGLHFRLAVLYAIVALALGNVMGAQHDFSMRTVHVHLNLLGWVSCALYGVYLRLHPVAAASALARVHFFVAHIGFVLFASGLAIIATTDEQRGVLPTASGGIVSLVGMLLFALLVFRTKAPAAAAV